MRLQALAPRRRAFVGYYLTNGFNGSKAARDAGYAPNSAGVEACRLLKNAQVRAAIDDVLASQELMEPDKAIARLHKGLWDVAEHGKSEPTRLRALAQLGRFYGVL